MTVFSVFLRTVALVAVAAPVASLAAAPAEPPNACYSGAYKFDRGGDYIVISPSDEGALRYRLHDGRSGRLYPDDDRHFHGGPGWASREPRIAAAVFDGCPGKRLEFRLKDGPSGVAQRMPVTKTPASFSSIGNTLYGELYAPPKPQALVVLVFGSGQDSAVTFNYVQHLLPIYDIAVFVYDKRGTGKSTGRFTVDFSELADDAVAAVAQARKLLPNVPVGLMGESQGGWIAPLAAARSPVDFVVVSYGLAISPLEEDREEVFGELRAKHYDESVMAKGRELTSITGRIMLSRFTDGLDDLAKFKAAHAGEKWLHEVEGDFTGPLLRSPDDQFTELRAALGFDAILDYDAQAALRRVRTPMLWVIAGKDTEAPPVPTLEFVRKLQAEPTQLDIAVFPNADHGMIDVEERGGELVAAVQSPGYYDLLASWIRTRKLAGKFGAAILQPDTHR
ncbi:MAG TPA: alpha/beta hydrolase [Steroidobacteraceae bacterium]|nr:alpha/beta hydrolase [Steroidobacteraceae bacterium]